MNAGRPIAVYWFLYFTGLGAFFPYYALYLRESAGLSGTQVGIVMASVRLIALIAQPLWGNIADRTGARRAVLAALTMATALSQIGMWYADGFVQLFVATCAMSVFSTAVVPISFSVAFAMLSGTGPHGFGYARMWGTIGFLIGVAGFPYVLESYREHFALAADLSGQGLEAMFAVFAALAATAALSCWALPRSSGMEVRAARGDWRELLANRAMLRLMVASFLAYLFLQGPIEMFPLFIADRGGDAEMVGKMWMAMLLLEIPLVALSGAGVQRLGARALLIGGTVAGGLRWIICALTTDETLLYAAQLLHGVVVAGLLIGSPLYLEKIVPERLRSTAQGALAMIGVGAGGLVSSVATGWLIDHAGIDFTYLAGGAGGLLLGLSLRWMLAKV